MCASLVAGARSPASTATQKKACSVEALVSVATSSIDIVATPGCEMGSGRGDTGTNEIGSTTADAAVPMIDTSRAGPSNSNNPLFSRAENIILSAASLIRKLCCPAGAGAMSARKLGSRSIMSSTATKFRVLEGQTSAGIVSAVPGRVQFPAWVTSIWLPATAPLTTCGGTATALVTCEAECMMVLLHPVSARVGGRWSNNCGSATGKCMIAARVVRACGKPLAGHAGL